MGRAIKVVSIILCLWFVQCGVIFAAPPAEYQIWDKMPYESGVKGKVTAKSNFDLYSGPRTNTVVGSVSAGERLDRASCVVYTHPAKHPVRVLKPTQTYKGYNAKGPVLQPGSYVYLLMYAGEATYIGLYNGEEVKDLNLMGIKNFSKTNQSPWGEYVGVGTSTMLSIEVWYCLRKTDGTTGWTKVVENGSFTLEDIKFGGRTPIF